MINFFRVMDGKPIDYARTESFGGIYDGKYLTGTRRYDSKNNLIEETGDKVPTVSYDILPIPLHRYAPVSKVSK